METNSYAVKSRCKSLACSGAPPSPPRAACEGEHGGCGQVAHNQGRPDPEPQGALKNVIQVNVMIRFLRKKITLYTTKCRLGARQPRDHSESKEANETCPGAVWPKRWVWEAHRRCLLGSMFG